MPEITTHNCPTCKCPAETYREPAAIACQPTTQAITITTSPTKKKPFLCRLGFHDKEFAAEQIAEQTTLLQWCKKCGGELKRQWCLERDQYKNAPLSRSACLKEVECKVVKRVDEHKEREQRKLKMLALIDELDKDIDANL